MLAGLVLIVMGVLIALFPQLLSIIVALILILAGALLMATAYQFRRKKSLSQVDAIRFIFMN